MTRRPVLEPMFSPLRGWLGVSKRGRSQIPVSGFASAGRFAGICIPDPVFFGAFVTTIEIVCGAMLILVFLTRPAAIALLIHISVAIISAKTPVLLRHKFLGFSLAGLPR